MGDVLPQLPTDVCERIATFAGTPHQILVRCSECGCALLEQHWHIPFVAHVATPWRRSRAWLLTSRGGLHPRLLRPPAPVARPEHVLRIAAAGPRRPEDALDGQTRPSATPTHIVDASDDARWCNATPSMRQVRAYKALAHGAFSCFECLGRLRRLRVAWRRWSTRAAVAHGVS